MAAASLVLVVVALSAVPKAAAQSPSGLFSQGRFGMPTLAAVHPGGLEILPFTVFGNAVQAVSPQNKTIPEPQSAGVKPTQ